MPERAKRFYLCNLIPLWEVDEENMDVDWPLYHAYFDDLIEMKADIKERQIRWTTGDSATVDPDLKIRFEVYESDFLLSGGRNDRMGVFSSHASFGDDASVRPIKIVDDIDVVPDSEREKFIFIHWVEGHETSVTITSPDGSTSTRTEKTPITLQVRCWWKVKEEEGGDVSGNPEYYYDIYLEGKLQDGSSFDLHERSDHELEGYRWHVTDKVRKGRVSPMVDGEYVFLKMLQLMDSAQHSIHIAAWSFEMHTALAVGHEFQADYAQIPNLSPDSFKQLLVRNKPIPRGVASHDGNLLIYSSSNGNINVARMIDPANVRSVVQQISEGTPFEEPTGVAIAGVDADGARILVLDARTSRLSLFIELKRKNMMMLSQTHGVIPLGKKDGVEIFGVGEVITPIKSTLQLQRGIEAAIRAGASEADIRLLVGEAPILVLVALAGQGRSGFGDLPGSLLEANPGAKVYGPGGLLNSPQDLVIVPDGAGSAAVPGRVFITDTGNHCVRLFRWQSMQLTTFAGDPVPGNKDGVGRAAQFRNPTGITWDSKQNRLLVADTGNKAIRAIDQTTAAVTTLTLVSIDGRAGASSAVSGLAFDPDRGEQGTLYAAERDRHRILTIDLKARTARTLAGSNAGERGYADGAGTDARFDAPGALAYAADKLFVADEENRVVRSIDVNTGDVSTLGSKTEPGPQDLPVTVADVLRRKAKEGVRVRVLLDSIDGLGAVQDADALNKLHENVRAFVQYHVQAIGDTEAPDPKDLPTSLASFHDKMMIVDSRAGFTGGIDFGSQKNNGMVHESFYEGEMFWHDQSALVEGPVALGLEEHFIWRWNLLRKELRVSDEAYQYDRPLTWPTAACFTMLRRHYEDERLQLDASCSKPTTLQDIKEYRWQVVQKFRYLEAVLEKGKVKEVTRTRDVPLLTATVPYAEAELARKLDPGEYNIRLTVKSSGGGEDSTEHKLEVLPAHPDSIDLIDRTNSTIQDHQAESVRTWDPSPVFINMGESEVTEILESYRRAILAARHYVYMEHQYIFYPEIGNYLEQAMKDNPRLQVIWVIPFFTEESRDPYQEKKLYQARQQFLSAAPQLLSLGPSINFALSIGRSGAAHRQLKSQLAWHGFFRQHEMVKKLRTVDPKRFGVFSMRRLFDRLSMIYPHSKMILCDDRFFSIGSANANGRGFVKDSEHNISALSSQQGKGLRVRLWGELLGYVGVAGINETGELMITAGHHLRIGDKIRLQHPAFGEAEREVTFINDATGGVQLSGGPLDFTPRRIMWTDPRIEKLEPNRAMPFWRQSCHTLEEYRKVQGLHAKTNASGELVIPGHLAKKDDLLHLGGRLIELDEEGFAKAFDGLIFPPVGGQLQVADISGDVIKLRWPGRQRVANREGNRPTWVLDIAKGGSKDIPPFKVKVLDRNEQVSLIEFKLLPNQERVAFDYALSWLMRQPAAKQNLRTWEIDPPEGIEYGGPGSILRWVLWPITDIDPDEHARLQGLGSDVRIA